MAPKQQVLVADIVKTLQATNQRLITKEKALQLFDDVFRQPKEADQVLDREMTHAYNTISPSPQPSTSSTSPSRRRKATTPSKPTPPKPACEPPELIRCVCVSTLDNGSPWICCETCSAWQHMNCMHVHWTPAEAAQHKYFCEKCAPAQHWDVLTMLREGTWDPLPFQSIGDGLEGWGKGEGVVRRGMQQGSKEREREVKVEPGVADTPLVSSDRSIQMIALQRRLQNAKSNRDHALATRIEADERILEKSSAGHPSSSSEAAPL